MAKDIRGHFCDVCHAYYPRDAEGVQEYTICHGCGTCFCPACKEEHENESKEYCDGIPDFELLKVKKGDEN